MRDVHFNKELFIDFRTRTIFDNLLCSYQGPPKEVNLQITKLFNKVRYHYTRYIICHLPSTFITHIHYGIRVLSYYFSLINILAYTMQGDSVHSARIIHYSFPWI